MDLYKLIPNKNDDRWTIGKNQVLFKNLVNIPVLKKVGSEYWICLDRRITKRIIEMTKVLMEHNIDFFYYSNLIIFPHKYTQEETNILNIRNYIYSMESEVFFDGINKIQFDYTQNLSDYISKYNCHDIFKIEYNKFKKDKIGKHMNWYSGKEEHEIKREDIRDYFLTLEREIKLSMLF